MVPLVVVQEIPDCDIPEEIKIYKEKPAEILFLIWWQIRHLKKIMGDVENILNDDDFVADTVDTPKEGVEQHKKI